MGIIEDHLTHNLVEADLQVACLRKRDIGGLLLNSANVYLLWNLRSGSPPTERESTSDGNIAATPEQA